MGMRKRVVFGMTTALILSVCSLPALAAGNYSAADTSLSAASSDATFLGGLDLEAQIIMSVEMDQRSPYANTGIMADEEKSYTQIFAKADTSSEVVGKLYAGSGCEIIKQGEKWTKIVSGDCKGYVKTKYLISGTDAEDYAEENDVSQIIATPETEDEEMFLYKDPSAASEIVSTVTWDEDVIVDGTSDDGQWVKVTIGKETGYIPSDSVILDVVYEEAVSAEEEAKEKAKAEKSEEKTEETEAETKETEAETKETEAETEETVAETKETEAETKETEAETEEKVSIKETSETVWATYSVSIRAGYSTDSEKLDVLVGGDSIKRTGVCDNGWSRVDYNGKDAYIKSEYLTTDEPEQEETTETKVTYETVYATTVVNMRAKASTDADILAQLSTGDSVKKIKEKNGWTKVKYDGQKGWIKSDYLSSTKPEVTVTYETVYATAVVNVRAKASTSANVLGQLSVGDSVKKIKTKDGWTKVKYNGQKGWVKSDYLSSTKPASESTSSSKSEVTVSKCSDTVYTTAGVNIRAKYSTSSKILGTAVAGSALTRTGKTSNGWSRVKYGNSTGYVKNDYLTTTKPASSSGSSSSSSASSTSSSSSKSSSSSSSLGQQIVDYALQWVGYPYVYGGNNLSTGVDCSGFTQQVYLHFGYSIPRRASIQATVGTAVSISNLQPGDLVFYGDGSVGHVTIYIGNGQVVHASTPEKGIIVTNMYYRTPLCARRII